MEIVWTIVPIVVLAGIIIPSINLLYWMNDAYR